MIQLKLQYTFEYLTHVIQFIIAVLILDIAHIFLQAQLYTLLELCRAFDRIFKEHLDGG